MKPTNELRRFLEVDNHETVKIGDLEKNLEAIKVVRPKFNQEIFPSAIIKEGVGEWMLREGSEVMLRSFINDTDVGTV